MNDHMPLIVGLVVVNPGSHRGIRHRFGEEAPMSDDLEPLESMEQEVKRLRLQVSVRPDLVDISEIAKRAGTTPGTVQTWRHRYHDFPAPLVQLRIGPVWEWAPVIEWLRRERKPGRPRKPATTT